MDASSNIAEYLALIEGLDALRDMGVCCELITVSGDAKCVLDQMRGSSSVHSESTKPFYNRAVRLSRWFNDLKWRWTPRRINRAADWLSRRALKQFYSDKSSYFATLQEINHEMGGAFTKKLHPVIDIRIYHHAPQVNPGEITTVTQLLNAWGNQIPARAYTH
jgi:ribonuclease HI